MAKRIVTLALPGDADVVVEWEVARAIHRDNRLTRQEHAAKAKAVVCCYLRKEHRYWPCSWDDPCPYCEELNDL